MSRWAVSCEPFASAAYFEVVSLPSNPLTVVEFHIFYVVPEARFGQDRAQGFLGAIDGASEAAEEPFHPASRGSGVLHDHGASTVARPDALGLLILILRPLSPLPLSNTSFDRFVQSLQRRLEHRERGFLEMAFLP